MPAHTSHVPRGRMPVSQRAKIFVPFNPLRGFQAALRKQERMAEERFREQDFSEQEDDHNAFDHLPSNEFTQDMFLETLIDETDENI